VDLANKSIVLVEWIDSKGVTSEWEFLEDLKPQTLAKCVSIGLLLEKNEEKVVLASHISDCGENNQVTGIMVIPMSSVLSLINLKNNSEYTKYR